MIAHVSILEVLRLIDEALEDWAHMTYIEQVDATDRLLDIRLVAVGGLEEE